MKTAVSKIRAQKTKSREKLANRIPLRERPLRENPLAGLLIAFLLWASVTSTVGAGAIFSRTINPVLFFPVIGDAIFLLVGLVAVGMLLESVNRRVIHDNLKLLLLSLIAVLSILFAKAIFYLTHQIGTPPPETAMFLLPLALPALLGTILISQTAGAGVGIWISMAIAILANRSFPLFITGVVITMITAQIAQHVLTRANVFRIGLLIGFSEVTCVLGFTAFHWETSDIGTVLNQTAACLAGGFSSALLALVLLPLFETSFRITTDITLLEMSDLGHPLLQRLAIEAPGTYHHSLVVAHLAQAAADEIEANALLARVASYYHDVGKLTKPDFFTENIQLKDNPHDDLPPSMSTLIITAHVKEGVSLALHYKLAPSIIKIIQEHHGTGLLSYFHHKAKSQLELELNRHDGSSSNEQANLDEGAFRYPGPKPSTTESAIVGLADAVEAASRSMEKVTPSHIEGLVNDIVNARIEDDQLSACDLTFAELARIKRSFVFTLTNMLHARIPYPKDENRDKQPAKSAPAGQTENKEPGTIPDEHGRPA